MVEIGIFTEKLLEGATINLTYLIKSYHLRKLSKNNCNNSDHMKKIVYQNILYKLSKFLTLRGSPRTTIRSPLVPSVITYTPSESVQILIQQWLYDLNKIFLKQFLILHRYCRLIRMVGISLTQICPKTNMVLQMCE